MPLFGRASFDRGGPSFTAGGPPQRALRLGTVASESRPGRSPCWRTVARACAPTIPLSTFTADDVKNRTRSWWPLLQGAARTGPGGRGRRRAGARRRRRGAGGGRRATELSSLDVFCLDLASLSLCLPPLPAAPVAGGGHAAGPEAAGDSAVGEEKDTRRKIVKEALKLEETVPKGIPADEIYYFAHVTYRTADSGWRGPGPLAVSSTPSPFFLSFSRVPVDASRLVSLAHYLVTRMCTRRPSALQIFGTVRASAAESGTSSIPRFRTEVARSRQGKLFSKRLPCTP